MKNFSCFSILVLLFQPLKAQISIPQFEWGLTYFGNNTHPELNCVTSDPGGNVIMCGYFSGTHDFDGGPGTWLMTSTISNDGAVVKISPAGNLLWAKAFNGPGMEEASRATTDAAGNIYLTGRGIAGTDLDPGPGVAAMTLSGGWVVKLDPAGNYLWSAELPTTGVDVDIAFDPAGFVLVSGKFAGTQDLDPGSGTGYLTSTGTQDIFILKLTSSGNFVWAKGIGGPQLEYMRSLSVDPNGNVLACGEFTGTCDFDPGPGVYSGTAQGSDYFYFKLNSSGQFRWARHGGSVSSDVGLKVLTDASSNVFVCGQIRGSCNFGPGPGASTFTGLTPGFHSFVLKTDSSGLVTWVDILEGVAGYAFIKTMTRDPAGYLYLAGNYLDVNDFDPGPGYFYLTTVSISNADIYLLKITDSGNFQWAGSIGSVNGNEAPYTIHYNPVSGLFLNGPMGVGPDVEPGAGVVTIPGAINSVTLLKFNECTTSASVSSAVACDSLLIPGQNVMADTSGNYTYAILNTSGCDSMVTLQVTIHETHSDTLSISDCNPVTVNGQTYSSTGSYLQQLSTMQGCDSLLYLFISLYPSTTDSLSYSACDSLEVNGQVYLASGIYTQTFTNFFGCDSIIVLDVEILPHVSDTIQLSDCRPLEVNGQVYAASGTYVQNLTTSGGCDSLLVIHFTRLAADTAVTVSGNTLTANAVNATFQWIECDSVPVAGATFASFTPVQPGSYAVIVTQNGCTDTSDCFTILENDINFQPEAWTVFPNPANGHFYLKSHLFSGESLRVSIYDPAGKMVFEDRATATNGIFRIPGSGEFGLEGFFLVKIHSTKHEWTGSILFSRR